MLGSTWSGPAKESFTAVITPLLDSLSTAAGLLRDFAQRLDEHADAIEHAQAEYRQCMAAVGITVGVGLLLTPVTGGASDGVAAGLAAGETAAATAIVATASELLLAALSDLAAQAVALAGRWALLFGASVAADAASGMVTYRDLNPLDHLHLEQDAQYALVGGLAVPIGARMLAGLNEVADGALVSGATGQATRLAVGGISTASADALVRSALGQGVDPGELVLAGLPLVPAGRGGGPRPALREVPLGFADAEEFRAFGAHLVQGLHAAGYHDVVPVFQGSSVTGVKHTTGELFDVGRTSDFDIALASPTLFARAKALGVELRGRRSRTGPIKEDEILSALGLLDLRDQVRSRAGRRVEFMIYKDLEHALHRGPSIEVP
jgi:hypothetical protein